MSSGSPRTRVDQYFPSRKKKLLSCTKIPKCSKDISPAKGTLDNYLVDSHDDYAKDPDAFSRPDSIKRNLLSEIIITSHDIPCPLPRSKSLPSKDASDDIEDTSDQEVKNKPCNTFPSEVSSDQCRYDPHGFGEHGDVEDRCHQESTTINKSESEKLELRQFASDFLSLYCSELPCNTSSHVEENLTRHKRNGSPSLLDAETNPCKKQQHVLSNNLIQIGDSPSHQDFSEPISGIKLKKEAVSEELGLYSEEASDEIDKESNISGIVVSEGLKRYTKTPGPFSSMVKCIKSSPSFNRSIVHMTSKLSNKCPMISPGESFWNEAIEVADGLFHPFVKTCEKLTEGYSEIEGQCEKKTNMCLLSDGMRSNIENTSSLSNVFPFGARDGIQSIQEVIGTKYMELSVASPLPVKHIDFSYEVQTLSEDVLIRHSVEKIEDAADHKIPSPNNQTPCHTEIRSDVQEDLVPLSEKLQRQFQEGLNYNHGDKDLFVSNAEVFDVQKVQSTSGYKLDERITPSSSKLPNDYLQLSRWFPSEICHIYMRKGISKLYPWQVDCLQVDGVLEKRNLVYCASTSAGKSFVAEILMLRRVISTGKMAMLVLPYVSICAEKADHLEVVLEPLGKHVRCFYGNQGGGNLPKDTSIAVCTIEKANSLVNKLLEEGRLSELGMIVIDELHMVGDQNRGYLLELLLTKLRYASGECRESSSGDGSSSSSGNGDSLHGLQIIGMSATMPNVTAVADWLQAALYETVFRPVPLEEYIKVGNTMYNKNMEIVRTFSKAATLGGKDPDHIVELCNEVVQEGHSVLVFCSSRKGCESTARHIGKLLKEIASLVVSEFSDSSSVIEALGRCPSGLDPVLEETVPSRVAYHHAGLTVEEREVIEDSYRKGTIRVLVATSTLAAGVNLPARRVIFRQPRIGRDFIDGTRYRQMAGRAGRTGIDTMGESILICKPEELKRVSSVVNDSCPPLQSCLSEDKNGMTHAILEVVAGGIVQTASDIHRYVRCTLLNSTKPFEDVIRSAQDSLKWLCHRKFLEWNEELKLYNTTPLGRASFGSSLNPEESLVVLDDLTRAREGFVLASELHLVYLVTPTNVDVEPDWELYYERFMHLSQLEQSVANRVGVFEPYLMRMAHGAPVHIQDNFRGNSKWHRRHKIITENSMSCNDDILRVYKRFFVALMLSKLVQEVPIADVSEGFKVNRGMLQSLQENAGRFASMVSLFCERLGWHDLEGLISKFQNRVSFGVRAEIVELTSIPFVKGSRARALYKSGLRTAVSIAEASISEIAKALFESSSWTTQGNKTVRHLQIGVAKKIKNGARKIVLERAEEARLAAFSAFKTLGIAIPQIPGPLFVRDTEKSLVKEDGKTSSEDSNNSFVGVQSRGSFTKSVSLETDRTDFPGKNGEGLLDPTIAGDVNLVVFKKNSCGANCSTIVPLKTTSLPHDSQVNDVTCKNELLVPLKLDDGTTTCIINNDLDHKIGRNSVSQYQPSSATAGKVPPKGPVVVSKLPGGFDCFLDTWSAIKEFYFDLHFVKKFDLNSLIPFEIHGFAICWENSPIYYVNLLKDLVPSSQNKLTESSNVHSSKEKDELTENVAVNSLWEITKARWTKISTIMSQISTRKITWNLKLQIQVLKLPGISTKRFGWINSKFVGSDIQLIDDSYLLLPSILVHGAVDLSLVAWILWPDEERSSSPNLDKEARKRLSVEVIASANRDGRWENQMHRAAHNGCCHRVALTRALDAVLWKLLVSENLVEALTKIENPLVNVLADMELWGIGVDMDSCLKARRTLVKKLMELEQEAYNLAGMPFSLYSSADIANVLYKKLKLPLPNGCEKGKQHPRTDKHSLDMLRNQHAIIPVIKEHRTLRKLLNSTLGSICAQAKPCMGSNKYIIRGHWLQTSTATGRLSMEEPNLQCVEHMVHFTIRNANKNNASISDITSHGINARNFFIPKQENWLLLTADYSQIELRLMAHFSKDSSLIELLSKPDGDVFTMIAAKWTGRLDSTITPLERDQTKRLIYGILYGMGTNTLAEHLGCSKDEAQDKIKSFRSSFPGVSTWLQEVVAYCHQTGYIETLKGRKRFLTKIKFGNQKENAKAQRQAINSVCQGSVADIIKIAMINIHAAIVNGINWQGENEYNGKEFSFLKERCHILLQVHDELVLEVDPVVLKESALLLKTSMEDAVSLLVPLHVKLKIGKSWGSLEPYT